MGDPAVAPGLVTGDTLFARRHEAACALLGGTGSFETPGDWVGCVLEGARTQAVQRVMLVYPRADAWLAEIYERIDEEALDGSTKAIRARAVAPTVQRWVDNGNGTVTDRMTGLMWEKKTDDGSVHDWNNTYSWSSSGPLVYAPDGTVFTEFLAELNGSGEGGCTSIDGTLEDGGFAGHCDWRLPTPGELTTILLAPYECQVHPCINETIFGPTDQHAYWTATSVATSPEYVWVVEFYEGLVDDTTIKTQSDIPARAVRGGAPITPVFPW